MLYYIILYYIICPHSTYGVYMQQRMRGRVTVSGATRMTLDEFSMHDVPRCLDNQEDKTARCRAERGTGGGISPPARPQGKNKSYPKGKLG